MARCITVQAQQTENIIKEEFQKLYQFLRAEEAARIDAVRKEAKLKSEAMDIRIVNLSAEISWLTDSITAIESELKSEDVSFMLNLKSTMERSEINLSVSAQTPSGALLDEAQHLGNLQFAVWKKMKNLIKYSPLTLDPNTGYLNVIESEGLTRIANNYKTLPLPQNPERLPGVVHSSHSNNKLRLNGAGDERGDGERGQDWRTGWRPRKIMDM
ncbi:hypothetical protein Q5P01_005044 [Channa striata]|uniref:Uncharacterized protein n=1 Tax=Channa striata TaxID=64152 RepID=A0AA88NCX1_CHASR|nr:hypothetical protein Q5P01_005044 [Channa striata]